MYCSSGIRLSTLVFIIVNRKRGYFKKGLTHAGFCVDHLYIFSICAIIFLYLISLDFNSLHV
jgi:hypothetical protein